jgi:hypothetical protein
MLPSAASGASLAACENDPRPGRERLYRRDLDPNRWLRVIIEFSESPAYVVTAFVQDHPPEGWPP